MKILNRFSFVTMIFFCLFVWQTGHGQYAPSGTQPFLHGKNFFLQMEHSRLTEILNLAAVQKQKEKDFIDKLNKKNDSLLLSGNIYDSVSDVYRTQIAGHQRQVDSISALIQSLNKSINPFSSFRRQYKKVEPVIGAIDSYVKSTTLVTDRELKRINDSLDASDLSGEKTKLKDILHSASEQQAKETVRVGKIGNKKESLLQTGQVDDAVAEKVDRRLQAYQHRIDSIGIEIRDLESKLNSPKDAAKDFKVIKAKIILIDSVVNKNASAREYVFSMIDEGLSKSKRNLFPMAAFFGPGGYIIPEKKFELAKKYFLPLIDSLIEFSNKYETLLRTASIQVNGYADASPIGKRSRLYDTLSTWLNKPEPSREELNSALSSFRADEISKLLTRLLKEKFSVFKSINNIVFEALETGRGEKLPDPAINDYKKNDDRRRVVVLFWSVLPSE